VQSAGEVLRQLINIQEWKDMCKVVYNNPQGIWL